MSTLLRYEYVKFLAEVEHCLCVWLPIIIARIILVTIATSVVSEPRIV